MQPAEALARMRAATALWGVGYVNASDVVVAACDLLVAGFDGPHLGMLAGVSAGQADEEVPRFVEGALREVDLDHHRPGSLAGNEAALRILAARVVAGDMTPRELTGWAWRTFGHGSSALAERLVELEDVYETYGDLVSDEVDAMIVAAARRVAAAGSGADR
ncbi:hypothetical protein [Micromonospora echinofusca]|uniref:DUF4375 domain-containing protein n=1 Tax=Micromonospora echinofusca TaxID=47858 RepID=A0ABS3VSH7_MICEH|nr:hypothetical protein [Micromonospora echinofusca]MBO4207492.1 hypothetical protein [Micromonospora echinofusca]